MESKDRNLGNREWWQGYMGFFDMVCPLFFVFSIEIPHIESRIGLALIFTALEI